LFSKQSKIKLFQDVDLILRIMLLFSDGQLCPSFRTGETDMTRKATLKATTLNRSTIRATAKPDYAAIGKSFGEAVLAKQNGDKLIDANAVKQKEQLAAPLFDLIRTYGTSCKGITAAQFAEHIQPAWLAAMGQDKFSPNLTKYRNAFLGFAHGIECPKGMNNAQHYASEIAQPALIEMGVIKPSNAGRKAGKANEKKGGNDPIVGYAKLFGLKGDAHLDLVELLTIAVEGKAGKLLIAKLNEIADLLEA